MAVILYKSADRTVADIAARNAIVHKIDHMVVTVLDAIADINAGAGVATYRYNESLGDWILVSKSGEETINFATEELTISLTSVTASNVPLDGVIWNIAVVNGNVIQAEPRLEDLTVTGSTISGLDPAWNGMNLRFTYAYGSFSAQVETLIDTKYDKAGGEISGHVLPSADITYDLGSPTNKWRDLYLSSSTIYLGTSAVSVAGGKLQIDTGSGAVESLDATSSIGTLADVDITGISNGQTLTWNGTSFEPGAGGGGSTFDGGSVTNPVLLPNGSAAQPSVSFTNYTDTGMYAGAVDTLDFSVNGTRAFYYDGANNFLHMDGHRLVGLAEPAGGNNAATKNYVDTAVAGISSFDGTISGTSPTLTIKDTDTARTDNAYVSYVNFTDNANTAAGRIGYDAAGVKSLAVRNDIPGGDIRFGIGGNSAAFLMSSTQFNVGNKLITNVSDPNSAQQAATKNYVDTAIAGVGGATVLNDLTDVDTTGVASGNMLHFDGTNWVDTNLITTIAGLYVGANTNIFKVDGNNPESRVQNSAKTLSDSTFSAKFNISDSTTSSAASFGFPGSGANPLQIINNRTNGDIDFWSGGSRVISYDGANNFLNLLSNRIVGLADPSGAQDAATKGYVDSATGGFVIKSGDTMTGLLTLSGDPTANLHAATKQYVDSAVSGISSPSIINDLTDVNVTAASFGALLVWDGTVWTDTNGMSYNGTDLSVGGKLTNVSEPVSASDATNKSYVDTAVANVDLSSKLDLAGGTLTGALTLAADPVSDLQAATKKYVDDLSAGLDPKQSCKLSSVSNIGGTYNSTGGTGGSGEFTGVDLTATAVWDDLPSTLNVGDRVLVQNQTDAKQNGIYSVVTAGATGVIERAPDHDGTPTHEVSGGNTTFVESGTVYGGKTFALSGTGNKALNTDDINWIPLASSTDWIWGTGLTATGSTVNLDASINDLTDVNISSPQDGALLRLNGSSWVNSGVKINSSNSIVAVNGTVSNPSLIFESSGVNAGIYYNTTVGCVSICDGNDDVARFEDNLISLRAQTLVHSIGSATAPQIAFSARTDTGFWFTSNSVSFSSFGNEVIRITGNSINMLTNKIENVANPTSAQDAATKAYVDTQLLALGPNEYAQTSTATGVSIVDTSIVPEDGIYNIMIKGNPNSAGSPSYVDVIHLKAYVTTGWNGSAVTTYINVVEEFSRGGLHGSAGGPLTADVVFWDGTTETSEYDEASVPSLELRVKVSGYNTGVEGSNQTVKIEKVL